MTTPATPARIRWHYLLTLRAIRSPNDPSVAHTHAEGTYVPAPGQTRQSVFMDLLGRETEKLAVQGFGITHKPVALFFALEPDELAPDRWAALRSEIQQERATHYDHACDLIEEGKDDRAERAFGRVDAYDEVLAAMDRMEAGR